MSLHPVSQSLLLYPDSLAAWSISLVQHVATGCPVRSGWALALSAETSKSRVPGEEGTFLGKELGETGTKEAGSTVPFSP